MVKAASTAHVVVITKQNELVAARLEEMETEKSAVAKEEYAAEKQSQVSSLDNNNEDQLHTPHGRLTAFFWAHDPRRVDKVDELLLEHIGNEEQFIQKIHREHGVRDFGGEIAIDDLYEHERYSYLTFSWGSKFPGHLLPTDRKKWSGFHGAPSSQTRTKVEPQLPLHWKWTSEWEIDTKTANCDANGWNYAFDFTNLNFMVKRNGGRKDPKATDYVRRRRWVRTRERIPIDVPLPAVNEGCGDPEDTTSTGITKAEREGDDFNIPDSLDVDDEEGEDPGDDEDENNYDDDEQDDEAFWGQQGSQFPQPQQAAASTGATDTTASKTTRPAVVLEHFSLTMEKPAIDAAWNMAVKNLETIYGHAKSYKTLHKKKWTVKKEKIHQQMNLLEKTIASMQSFVHDEHLKRRHSSSNLNFDGTEKSKGLPKTYTKFPLSPDGKSTLSPTITSSRIGANDETTGINLASKLKCAQSKLDALKRLFWHPREKNYTLRFSIDGIFYGLRDFLVESFKSSFAFHMSHQSNGASGITPTCKLTMKGHVVCCGKHVKVIGEKGTIVPKSLWEMMFLDSDFELNVFLIYVDDMEKERNPWLADKPTGKWEFLFAPESTRVELTNFTRRTKGGIDLPEPVVRKLMSDVLSGLVRELALEYFPQEMAIAFETPPSKLDLEGDIEITGVPIDSVMEKEIELTSGDDQQPPPVSPSPSAAGSPVTSPGLGTSSPIGSPSASRPMSPSVTSTASLQFAAVAAAATATVNRLIHNDTEESMRKIAEVLQLSMAQLNLLVALRQCGLYASPYSFRSVSSICDYFTAFFANDDGGFGGAGAGGGGGAAGNGDKSEATSATTSNSSTKQLRTTWKQLLELAYIRKTKAQQSAAATTTANTSLPKYELFDMDLFFERIQQLTRKPAKVEIHVTRFNCTLNAHSIVEAMAQVFERVVLGIEYSKPRVDKKGAGQDRLLYGFRFGRKPNISKAAALSSYTQSAQLLNPTIHLQMDPHFRNRLKAFSKFCRALKGGIELVKQNLETLSLELAGHVQGTGQDCLVHGSFKDLDFTGPVSLSLHVPALFLGVYKVQTIPLGNDRIGLQVELLLPNSSSNKKKTKVQKRDKVLFRAMVTDFAMDVLLDVDALIAKHHTRSVSSASELTAPWAPSASFKKQVESEKTKAKHPALSISVQATTGEDYNTDENIVRIPSPTNNPNEAYGKIKITSSELTKLHVQAKTGCFATRVMVLLKLLFDHARPFFLASFPEHQVLFDRLYLCGLKWLCGKTFQVDFDLLIKSFLHEITKSKKMEEDPNENGNENENATKLLFFTVTGVPTHPTPVVYRDEIQLLDVILHVDDLVNIWIDDKYPPYSNPLYF